MTEITLTTEGQFTFNQQLLDHLGVKAGEKVLVKKLPDGSLKIEADKNQIDILSLSGSIQSDIHATDAELQDSIRQSYIQPSVVV
ncbi:hypothetical protein [Verminephrobacter aporrectodeae]|uniref:hypothetical protein n=1 Tax=Verminephrobacter aporrectodeae TaxID=1110389 RepID=UPI002243FD08|nr:hypothetical protein [Verminephrobacter aporrectodeae]MCW8176607.1 AbrB/MazE/SpoVT family DNA-binding domain-containing protein [Verminephrobacter aporrectodeae subsp. tuberculatae]MCW8204236.1 AbrB/MazE/SpoVT family DNA-binding domain-containing protein [Verminephrobacter aporrectodeae subsp. tuberculatae]